MTRSLHPPSPPRRVAATSLLIATAGLVGCASAATADVAVTPPPAVPTVTETAPAAPLPRPEPEPVPAAPEPPSHAPVPFEANAIRAATQDGRTYVFLISEGKGPQTRRKIEFSAPDDEGATMRVTKQDLFGHDKGTADEKRVTWKELVGHATYPAEATTITEDEVKVPAGRYETKLYTVKETKAGAQQITRAWFALTLPGAPVKHEVERDGTVVSRMELFQHRSGE